MEEEIVNSLVVKVTGSCFITVFMVTPAKQTLLCDMVSYEHVFRYLSALVGDYSRCSCQFEDSFLTDRTICRVESEQCWTT